jgi:O-antigen ligase
MIRLTALYLFVGFIAIYAWKDWYRALCGAVVLMAVIQHPDMPKSMFGIQGLNVWNIAFGSVLVGWFANRRAEGLKWDLPAWLNAILLLYLGFIVVGVVRMLGDRELLRPDETTASIVSEYLINSVKWVIPGLLMFDGCRNAERLKLGLASVLAVYVLLALQVIRWLGPHMALSGEDLGRMAIRLLQNEVGYHRVNLSTMFAGASWAMLASRAVFGKNFKWTALALTTAAAIVIAQALTAGRTGYGAWAALGLMLGALRWRKALVLAPMALIAVVTFLPAVSERMQQGFTEESRDSAPEAALDSQYVEFGDDQEVDLYTVTSGRTLIWPFVLQKIAEAPVVGHGRLAMQRTGVTRELREVFGESEAVTHPHNAYLEWLLDNGWVGMGVIAPLYLSILFTSMRLFRDRRLPVFEATGGAACALVGALLLGAIGSQSFYPREGAVGMWCAIGLMWRVTVERKRALAQIAEHSRGVRRGRLPKPTPPTPPPPIEAILWPKAS